MSMARKVSLLFGIVFLVCGIGAYVPMLSSNGMLFGLFAVDSMHNIVHIVVGVLALAVYMRESYAKLFFRVVGIVYLIFALVGFFHGGDVYLMQDNMADSILYLVFAIIGLYFGFLFKKASA